ncbi:hypothetical protein AB0O67_00835 [Streptomyces sp. NPDC086077]|uniref:DUF6197 family protein n=1 Tax=Streptomyces sp. NPDC086077 TaxID=3154862 RepID=UPI00341E0316
MAAALLLSQRRAQFPMSRPAPAPVLAPAPAAPAAELSLDARLALVDAAMTVRLDEAAVAHEVRTAYLRTKPAEPADVVTVPFVTVPFVTVPPEAAGVGPAPADLYPTPVAALLQRAHHRLLSDGWCSGAPADGEGAHCMQGAVRVEAGGDRGLESSALAVLLETVRRSFGDHVDSVPGFNDAFGSGRVPVRMVGRAAALADARGL